MFLSNNKPVYNGPVKSEVKSNHNEIKIISLGNYVAFKVVFIYNALFNR